MPTAAADTIVFNIPGTGVHTINVGATALPTITGAVIIDGWSDPNYAGTPVIELNGSNAGSRLERPEFRCRQQRQHDPRPDHQPLQRHGIEISGSNNQTIQGNWIGLNAAGTAAAANAASGICRRQQHRQPDRRHHGGGAQRDLGQCAAGHLFRCCQHQHDLRQLHRHQRRRHGDVNGTMSNLAQSGIFVSNGSSGNVIGGTTAAARNVISGNNHYGFEFLGATTQNNLLQGNYIGTDVHGAASRWATPTAARRSGAPAPATSSAAAPPAPAT